MKRPAMILMKVLAAALLTLWFSNVTTTPDTVQAQGSIGQPAGDPTGATTGTAADVIYTLPATASTVFLEDDGASGNGMLQLRTSSGTFTTTIFANPTSSLTINRGNASDTITINALPDFTASLTIGSAAAPLSSVTFAGAMTLAADKSLAATVSGAISLPNAKCGNRALPAATG